MKYYKCRKTNYSLGELWEEYKGESADIAAANYAGDNELEEHEKVTVKGVGIFELEIERSYYAIKT